MLVAAAGNELGGVFVGVKLLATGQHEPTSHYNPELTHVIAPLPLVYEAGTFQDPLTIAN